MSHWVSYIARFPVDAAAARRILPTIAASNSDFDERFFSKELVVEVIAFSGASETAMTVVNDSTVVDQPQLLEIAINLSTSGSSIAPNELRSWIAFCNCVRRCDQLRKVAIPAIEAEISFQKGALVVQSQHYRKESIGGSVFAEVLRIQIDSQSSPTDSVGLAPLLPLTYQQLMPEPDLRYPGYRAQGRPSSWAKDRLKPRWDKRVWKLTFADVLWPGLSSLSASGQPLIASSVITSSISDPNESVAGHRLPMGDSKPLNLASTVGTAGYRFEDMEIIGYRIELPPPRRGDDTVERMLAKLIEPLNFPREEAGDFRYGVASRTIVVELLRYGKMKNKLQAAPLTDQHYTSQHELLIRLLVGRVDEGAAEAREPATYVASIFVDNPASKAIGLELQGYPKRLANFCMDGDILGCDGRLNQVVAPLENINNVALVNFIGKRAGDDIKILDVKYSIPEFSTSDDGLVPLSESLLGGRDGNVSRWQQEDFDSVEFRRSFARETMSQGLRRARTVQVVPLNHPQEDSPKTWLTGSYALTNIRFQRPEGMATLTFHPGRSGSGAVDNAGNNPAHDGWYQFSEYLFKSTGTRSVSLPGGHWYRVKCDMDLTIDDGLAW